MHTDKQCTGNNVYFLILLQYLLLLKVIKTLFLNSAYKILLLLTYASFFCCFKYEKSGQ